MSVLRRLFLLLLLVLAAPALAVPALWQVSNGTGGTLTLFGTIHVLPTRVLIGENPPDPEWFSPRARAAFDAADTLVVEILPSDDPATQGERFLRLARLPVPVAVASRLPARLRPQYQAMVDAANLPAAQLDGMKNWAVALALVQAQVAIAGLDPGSGADVTLMTMARSAGKRLVALETADGQLQLFNGLSAAEQRLMLVSTVEDGEKAASFMNDMVSSWQSGDLDALARAFSQGAMSTAVEKRLLHDRNRLWAAQVSRMLSGTARLFMAVGAGHMAGPDSLIPMLERRGFKVERLQ